jgi:tetratricopeptide (TPR) repeat protein
LLVAVLLSTVAIAGFEESFRAGLLALQRGDLAAADANLSEAAKIEPKNARVWVALARVWWKMDRAAKASEAGEKASALGGNDAVVQSSLAVFWADAGEPLRAARAQARFAELVPGDAAARSKAEAQYFGIAEPLLQRQKFGEAVEILKEGAGRVRGSAQLELALGVGYYALRRFDEAAGAFLRTIAIDAELTRPYEFLGRFLGQIPDKVTEVAQAAERYEKAHPDRALGWLLHGKAVNASGGDARAMLTRAIELDGRDASAHFEMGVALERSRELEKAAAEFARAAELDPRDSAAHYRLSRLYDRLGKSEEARREREIHARLVGEEEERRK